jgi:hypothetical protein
VASLIALSAVLSVMLGAFIWFYTYSRTPRWGDSETRKAVLRVLVMIGPVFGMHYRPPRPEPPTISAPGPDEQPTIPGVETSALAATGLPERSHPRRRPRRR